MLEARQDVFELLAEVLVEPGVEERVVAGGAHGDGVRDEEEQVEVGPVRPAEAQVGGDVVQDVHQVQGQPGEAEDGHHGDQHAVGAPLPLSVRLLLAQRLGAGLALGPAGELQRDERVCAGDDEERYDELQHGCDTAERQTNLPGKVLLTNVDVIVIGLVLHEHGIRQRG